MDFHLFVFADLADLRRRCSRVLYGYPNFGILNHKSQLKGIRVRFIELPVLSNLFSFGLSLVVYWLLSLFFW